MNIIYQDSDVLVVNKPAGLLVDEVQSKYQHAHLVHRLDRDTSGVIILAKSEETAEHLRKQFKEREVVKKYIALVHGKVGQSEGVIDKPISKSRSDFRKFTTSPGGRGMHREAVTRYDVRKRFARHTLLDVFPKTGRTHQIRVHLASIGHAVVGDARYGGRREKETCGIKRHALHASSLSVALPNGEKAQFEADIPTDLADCIEEASVLE